VLSSQKARIVESIENIEQKAQNERKPLDEAILETRAAASLSRRFCA